ncbi:hypothetical protein Pla22_17610 [Rubripirellula amarantea]|uniref:Uncharacterized protein n=1 Tax=Rubripirellula amarantea TaxID=2527999 RepID=A0A5C5WTW8_9BACT|nr:hypothetical protein Pla22_17610 [Rubripirellula amarantea]
MDVRWLDASHCTPHDPGGMTITIIQVRAGSVAYAVAKV